jgi:hypothetical protein
MPKVSVTIKDGREKRTYEDEYAFVYTVHERCGSPEGRWMQQPQGWKGGMGLFFAGVEALKVVAEQEGSEKFKVAARAALDSINSFAVSQEDTDESEGKGFCRSTKRGKAE